MIRRAVLHDATSFDDALTSGDLSHLNDDTADLVRTAQALTRSAMAEPSLEFRAGLRDTLMAEAADVLVAQPHAAPTEPTTITAEPGRPVRRRLVGLTAALVTAVGSVGMISSSATAVPGDVLYPIKQGVESVQLTLHRGDTARGEFQLDQARERLAEASWLDAHDQDDRVAEVLETFTSQASAGSSDLFAAYGVERDTQSIDTVNDFAAGAAVMLGTMSDDLPADAQAALASAADAITGLASQASVLCTACSPAELSSLIAAVDAAVKNSDAATSTSEGSAPDSTPGSVTVPKTDSNGSPAKQPAKQPAKTPATPVPTPTSLKELTDPLIGGLLGDENQEGLVPSVLDGLLGGKN
jgi:hypothetical protein